MSNDEELDVYSDDYKPDPVAQKAAREAVAATEPESNHPWASRFLVAFGILVVVIGTVGLLLGALNTVNIAHQNRELQRQNAELQREQKCISQLLINFEVEQNARGQVAADDRKAVDDIIKRVSEAKSPADVKRAFKQYYAERKDNDQRRAKYPLPSDPGKCLSPEDRAALQKRIPGSTVAPYTIAPKPTPKPTPTKKPKAHAAGQPGNGVAQTTGNAPIRPHVTTGNSGSGMGKGPVPSTTAKPTPKPPVNTPSPTSLIPILDPLTSAACVLIPLRLVCS